MTTTSTPTCEMVSDCPHPVTHIDEDGFVYCSTHGQRRQTSGWKKCRKLRTHELRRLERGEQIVRY